MARARQQCTHLGMVKAAAPSGDGCQECLAMGDTWVHLRLCRTCGHVGCCDDSKNRHARKHFQKSKHAIISSFEPGDGKVLAQAVRGRRRGHAERRGRLAGPASGTDRA